MSMTENAGRIAELQHERESLLATHQRLTSRLIADLYATDNQATLEALTDESIAELVAGVRSIASTRDRLKKIAKAIRELAG